MRSFVVAAVLLVPVSAIAQPASTPPPAPAASPMPTFEHTELDPRMLSRLRAPADRRDGDDGPDAKSGTTATLLAVGTTAAGAGLIALASQVQSLGEIRGTVALAGGALLVVGPSAGHFYAGEGTHGVVTSALRVGAVGIMAAGLAQGIHLCAEPCYHDDTGPELVVGLGAALYLGLGAYDILDAHGAADRANHPEPAYAVVPTVIPAASGNAGGLAVVGSF